MISGLINGRVLWDKPYKGSVTPTSLVDRSRFGNNGTHTDITMEQLDSGLWVRDFNGTNSRIDCGSDNSLNFTKNFSVDFWLRCDAVDKEQGLFNRGVYQISGYAAEIYSNNRIRVDLWQSGLGATFYTNTGVIDANIIYHIAIVRNGASGLVYIDGADATQLSQSMSDPVSHSGSFVMGNFTTHYLDGWMGLLKAYNYALTASQIFVIFQKERHYFGV